MYVLCYDHGQPVEMLSGRKGSDKLLRKPSNLGSKTVPMKTTAAQISNQRTPALLIALSQVPRRTKQLADSSEGRAKSSDAYRLHVAQIQNPKPYTPFFLNPDSANPYTP